MTLIIIDNMALLKVVASKEHFQITNNIDLSDHRIDSDFDSSGQYAIIEGRCKERTLSER